MRKASVRVKVRSKQIDNIFKGIARSTQKANNSKPPISAELLRAKYIELVAKGGRPATDWVCKLGEQCYILYVCVGCDIAPIAANMWYRCAKQHVVDMRGQYSG